MSSRALDQVRHLARLLWTIDTLLGAMVSLSVLQVAAGFAAAQTPPLARPDLPSTTTIEHGRRYIWLLSQGLDPRLDDEGWAELAPEPGLCVAVNEHMLVYAGTIRPLLADDLAAPLRRFDALVRQTAASCRPSWNRKLWENPDLPVIFEDDDDILAEAGRLGNPAAPVDQDHSVLRGPS